MSLLNPTNRKPGFRITELWAYVATEPDGTEGVAAIMGPDEIWHPLIGADLDRVKSYRPHAESIQRAAGCPMVLARFSVRENVEEIKG